MKPFIPLLAMFLVFIISGCLSVSPEALIKTSPVVQEFLSDYPNAEIKATFYSEDESAQILDTIKSDCEKEIVTPKDFYKVVITDEDSGLSVTAWVDWNRQLIECAIKKTVNGEKLTEKEYQEKKLEENQVQEKCRLEYHEDCYEGHVYKLDACGNAVEKVEYCQYGCSEGKCKELSEDEMVKKCYEGHVYLFDNAGNKIKKYQYCEYGCEDAKCVEKETATENETGEEDEEGCYETDDGYDIYHKGVAEAGEQRLEDHCNDDGTLTEKYCEGDVIKANSVNCPAGYACQDGACILKYECKDTDATDEYPKGLNYNVKGVTEELEKGVTVGKEDDYCGTEGAETGYLREYYCDAGHMKTKLYNCIPGTVCKDGACVEETNCTEHAEKRCVEDNVYWFDSCGDMEEQYEECSAGCSEGECLSETNVTS